MFLAVGGDFRPGGFLVFPAEEGFGDAYVDVIPREDLVGSALAGGVELHGQARVGDGLDPLVEIEEFLPRIELAAHLPCVIDGLAQPAVASCNDTLQNGGADLMPRKADLPGGDGVGQGVLLFDNLVIGVLRRPLEGGKGLGNEGGNGDGNVDGFALGLGGEGVVKIHHPER